MYALHESQDTELHRKFLLGHLLQVAEMLEHATPVQAHALLVRMFIFSPQFDMVTITFLSISFTGCSLLNEEHG